ncbi:hypothetical protein CRG98_020238 [Punica granatum]|uniref:Uncharacterized protein n=1 Tax=Punica granatum TaxID=22663 RepID=A0A2I0JTY7_PUNGR|nr:hypothetical protein CRG98_020238 [Punica granatum]
MLRNRARRGRGVVWFACRWVEASLRTLYRESAESSEADVAIGAVAQLAGVALLKTQDMRSEVDNFTLVTWNEEKRFSSLLRTRDIFPRKVPILSSFNPLSCVHRQFDVQFKPRTSSARPIETRAFSRSFLLNRGFHGLPKGNRPFAQFLLSSSLLLLITLRSKYLGEIEDNTQASHPSINASWIFSVKNTWMTFILILLSKFGFP